MLQFQILETDKLPV